MTFGIHRRKHAHFVFIFNSRLEHGPYEHLPPVDILLIIIVFQRDNAYVYVYKRINTCRNLGSFAVS
jgi:hypothetical protein